MQRQTVRELLGIDGLHRVVIAARIVANLEDDAVASVGTAHVGAGLSQRNVSWRGIGVDEIRIYLVEEHTRKVSPRIIERHRRNLRELGAVQAIVLEEFHAVVSHVRKR